MAQPTPTITFESGVWVVRVERPGGKQQEYRCVTEAQAKALVESLRTKPDQ